MTRVRQDSEWANGTAMTAAEWNSIDAGLTAAINGDGGGTYNSMAAPFEIGGAGIVVGSPVLIDVGLVSPHSITLDEGWIEYTGTVSDRTRHLASCPVSGAGFQLETTGDPTPPSPDPAGWGMPQGSMNCSIPGKFACFRLRVHNGATMTNVRLHLASAVAPSAGDVQVEIFEVAADGTTTEVVARKLSVTDLTFVAETILRGYFDIAASHVVDSKKTYWIRIYEPNATIHKFQYVMAVTTMSSIGDSSFA